METNNNDIDKFFRESLEGQSSAYIPGAWERMETMLNDGNNGLLLKNVHRYVLASIVGTILLAGSVVAYVSGYDKTTNTLTENQTPATVNQQAVTENNNEQSNSTAANGVEENVANNNSTVNTTTTSTTTKNAAASKPATSTNTKKGINKPAHNNATTVIEKPESIITVSEDNNNEPIVNTAEPATELEESTFEKHVYDAEVLGTKQLQIGINTFDNSSLDANLQNENDNFTKAQVDIKKRADRGNLLKLNYGLIIGESFNRVISNTGGSGWGSGLLAGIYFSKNLPSFSRFGFDIGANYMRMNSNSIGRTVTQTTYFFEKTTTNYYLLTKSFDYLQVPISVHYDAGVKHRFSLGLVTSLMVNSQTEVAQQKEKTGEFISTTKTEKGVYEDFNRWGYGLMAGYEFKMPGIYSLGVRYNQQLSNLTINSYFNDNKNHLPASLQLYLKLNLTR